MPDLTILHGCRTLQLSRGFNTLIDEEDYAILSPLKWHAMTSTYTSYARRTDRTGGEKTLKQVHRVVLRMTTSTFVDHINGDGLDNRKDNLRLCTQSANCRNRRRSKGASRFKGVSQRGDRFRAYFCPGDGKVKSLGTYDTETEAAKAYDAAAIRHYGEFAKTNADIHGDY